MRNVLITGAAGFIGSHLTERLLARSNDHLICVDNFSGTYSAEVKQQNLRCSIENPRVRFFPADIGDANTMCAVFEQAKPEVIVHLAAHAGVTPSVAEPRRYMENNVLGTLNLLELARMFGVKRFLFISSSTVYGKGCEAPFREDGHLGIRPSPYGASKRSAEILCQTYELLHGVPVVILRPFSVYGSRMRPDLALSVFAHRIVRGQPIDVFGDGTLRRDFTHVSDICRGIHAAMETSAAVGHCINLGNNRPLQINEVLAILQESFGTRARVDYHPERREDMPVTHADMTKANRLLGYLPETPFREGVREFVSWYQSQVPQG